MLLGTLVEDYLRAAAGVLVVITILITLVIFVVHFRRWRAVRDSQGKWAGLKPFHVWTIALAYIVALVGLTGGAWALRGGPIQWYATPMLIVSCLLALFALALVLQHVYRLGRSYNGPERRIEQASRIDLSAVHIAIPIALVSLIPSLIGFARSDNAQQDIGSAVVQIEEVAHRNAELASQSRETACSIARLVSYVPAIQFEGEPQSNFVNWILARRALLQEAREARGCSEEVEAVLAERVRLDQQVLDELQKP